MPLLPFCGVIPDYGHGLQRLHYDLQHDMWACRHVAADPAADPAVNQDRHTAQHVILGITAYGLHLAGEIVAFTAKPPGALIERGRSLGSVESAKSVHAVRSPLSGRLMGIHEALEDQPQPLNHDPYVAGWLIELACDDAALFAAEWSLLVDAAAYRQHVLACDPGARIAAQ